MVFGGSWGSTLSLAYAQTHPERVTEMVLRGIFLFQQYELDWLYKDGGASSLYPDAWDDFVAPIPADERGELLLAYRKRLTSGDPEVQLAAARAFSTWEGHTVTLLPNRHVLEDFGSPERAIPMGRIENHYMIHKGWLEERQLLENAERIRHIPGVIVQGRHDCCTPPRAAWALKKAWPEVDLQIVPDASHLYSEPGILDGLIRATDKFAGL
jgi:proline iminopeptidase